MSSFAENGLDRHSIIKWIITFALAVIIFAIPTSDIYTSELRMFFTCTVFGICLFAFELLPTLVSSLALPTLYLLTGVGSAETVYNAWSNTAVWMILGALVFCQVLEECGLLQRIAYWCINKCGGSFTGTLYGLWITGIVISIITFCNGFLIMVTLGYAVCKAMKLEKGKASALIAFVAMCAGETTCCFWYNPGYLPVGLAGIQTVVPDYEASWFAIVLYNWPLIPMMFLCIWLFAKMYKAKNIQIEGGKEFFKKAYDNLGPVSRNEKWAAAVSIAVLVYLLASPFLGLPDAYAFMIIPYVLFLPGIQVGTVKNLKNINYDVLFFVVACFSIGIVGTSVHVDTFISTVVGPILEGKSTLIVLLIMMTFGVVSNLFMTPYAMMAALAIPFAQLAVNIGIDPMQAIQALIISTDMVFFPHEVTPYLIIYGLGIISMKHFVTMHGLKTLITYVFFALVMFPYWQLLNAII